MNAASAASPGGAGTTSGNTVIHTQSHETPHTGFGGVHEYVTSAMPRLDTTSNASPSRTSSSRDRLARASRATTRAIAMKEIMMIWPGVVGVYSRLARCRTTPSL
jgi:hypothetical protein